jgi:hypothetical protein
MKTIQISNRKRQGGIRNVALLCVAAGALLTAAQVRGQTAPAITVDFLDLTDGNPTVNISANISRIVELGPEQAMVSFPNNASLPGGPFPTTAATSVLLMDPASDPFGPRVGDYVTLTITSDLVTIFFASDGAANFDSTVTGTSFTEDGTLQDMLNVSGLEIRVQSDLNTSEAPDAASTIGCFGLALGALAGMGRKLGVCRSRA